MSNYIERLLILGEDPHDILAPDPDNLREETQDQIEPLEQVTRKYIARAYRLCGKNKARTAAALDVSLSTLKRKLKQMNLS